MGKQETQTKNELWEIKSSSTVLLSEEYYKKGRYCVMLGYAMQRYPKVMRLRTHVSKI